MNNDLLNYEKKVIKKEGCWGWNGTISSKGNAITTYKKKQITASKASFIFYKDEPLLGMKVLLKCHNKLCSNPDHLYLGNTKDIVNSLLKQGLRNNNRQKSKNSKLTISDAKTIKEMLKTGLSYNYISRKYGVSAQAIKNISINKCWRNA